MCEREQEKVRDGVYGGETERERELDLPAVHDGHVAVHEQEVVLDRARDLHLPRGSYLRTYLVGCLVGYLVT